MNIQTVPYQAIGFKFFLNELQDFSGFCLACLFSFTGPENGSITFALNFAPVQNSPPFLMVLLQFATEIRKTNQRCLYFLFQRNILKANVIFLRLSILSSTG